MSAQVVNRVVGAGGLTLDDARRVVGDVIEAAGFTRRATARATTTFGREYRPRWLVVLSVVAAPPTLGLSLLALFVRARHVCTVTVESMPRGSTRVHLTGVLDAQIVRTLEDHLARHPVRPAPAPAPELLRDGAPTWAEVVGSAPAGDASDGPTLLGRTAGPVERLPIHEPDLAPEPAPQPEPEPAPVPVPEAAWEPEPAAPELEVRFAPEPERDHAPVREDRSPKDPQTGGDAQAAVEAPHDDEDAVLPDRSESQWFSTPQDPPTLALPVIPAVPPAPAQSSAPSAESSAPAVPALPKLTAPAPSNLRPRLERPSAPTVEPKRESGSVSWDEALGRSPRPAEPEPSWSPGNSRSPLAPRSPERPAWSAATAAPAVPVLPAAEPRSLRPEPEALPEPTPEPMPEPVEAEAPQAPETPDTPEANEPDGPAVVLVFDNGERVVVTGGGVMGRNPKDAGKKKSQVVKVNDPERSLSATHLAFGLEGEQLVIVDRRSTNGTWLVGEDAKRERCVPGERITVGPGTRVAIGARWFDVTRTE